jgi:putative ABC transport system permease protein
VLGGPAGFSEEWVEKLREFPGVSRAIPLVETRAFYRRAPGEGRSLYILGADLLQESAVRQYDTSDPRIMEDPLTFLNQPDSLIVTEVFAEMEGLKSGDQITLETSHGPERFTIRGLLKPVGAAKAYGGQLALMDIDGARMKFGFRGRRQGVDSDRVTRIDLVLEGKAEEIRAQLQTFVGLELRVETANDQVESFERMTASYQTMLDFFSIISLLVGVFIVFNSLWISVLERKRELGLLRALGMERTQIQFWILGEAVILGLVGGLLGIGGSFLLVRFLGPEISESLSLQLVSQVGSPEVPSIGIDQMFIALLLGAVTSGFATLIPAREAAQVSPLEAMRQSRHLERQAPFFKWTGGLGLVVGLLLLGSFVAVNVSGLGARWGWLDRIHQGFAVLSAAILGPIFVLGFLRMLRPFFRTILIRLGLENMTRTPSRTASHLRTLQVGVLLAVLITTVQFSFRGTMNEFLDRTLGADFFISSNGKLISSEVQPVDEELARAWTDMPGVLLAPGSLGGLRTTHFFVLGKRIALKAFDEPHLTRITQPFDFADRSLSVEVRTGLVKRFYDLEEDVIFVSENFVKAFGLGVGDQVEIPTSAGLSRFRILALIREYASPQGTIYISRPKYRERWGDHQVTNFWVYLDPTLPRSNLVQELERRVQSQELLMISNRDVRAQFDQVLDRTFRDSESIQRVALLIALLGLMNTLLMGVMERGREIATLRALGMTRKGVVQMIVCEALWQGLLGGVTAIAFGIFFAWIWVDHSLQSMMGWAVDPKIPWWDAWKIMGYAVILAGVAAIYPAWRAAQTEVKDALEVEN